MCAKLKIRVLKALQDGFNALKTFGSTKIKGNGKVFYDIILVFL